MALTADNNGRITTQPPSGNSMPPDLAGIIAASMAGASGSGASADAIPPLWINLRQGPATREVRLEGKGWRSTPTGNAQQVTTLDQAINAFYLMDDKYREELQKKMWYFGLIDGPNNTAQALSVWGDAVKMAAGFKAAGKDVNPIDMFAKMTNLKAGQLENGGANAPRTTTSRAFNTLDPEQAKTFIRQAYQEAMGRDPHDAEIRQLIGTMQEAFKAHPQVTQQTVDANGNTTSKVIDPGFDAQSFIANQMNADPERAAYQAASTYYPALQQALASPV